MVKAFNKIVNRCKCGIYLEINGHRDSYQSIKDAIKEINISNKNEIEEELAKKMIKENTIVSLQFYPDTPIGFYIVYGTSIGEVLNKAIKILEEE